MGVASQWYWHAPVLGAQKSWVLGLSYGLYIFFCTMIGAFRTLKKAGVFFFASLFLFLLLWKSERKLADLFRYIRIVIRILWIYLHWTFYIKSSYLRIPKIFFSWSECHLIMEKCSSEMHQVSPRTLYNLQLVYFLPQNSSPFLCFQRVFFRKFCPQVWVMFKSVL